ncbi:enolase C-terminal domain-like protein [Gordonia sp. CPCC 205333]|uniref:enolase C-terminal domain-like protein n=1 Tax=Gordonia sp. CPCC 205333 TaxID=3140790 RepID=UPI003AF34B58
MDLTIEIFTTTIALAATFGHGQAIRGNAESVVVAASDGATTGWGEGAPRRYVTGETLLGAADALARHRPDEISAAVGAASTFPQALDAVEAAALSERLGNAAACALETALLDVILRRFGRPAADLLAWLDPRERLYLRRSRSVPYSYVVESSRPVAEQLDVLAANSGTSPAVVKVKAHADVGRTVADVREIRATPITASASIVIDANGIWDLSTCRGLQPIRDDLAWVEEPTRQRDWDELAAIRRDTGLPVMLDESVTCIADLNAAVGAGAVDLVNVRISKFGGVIATSRAITKILRQGKRFQLGVQVAEVGPLWAFGRHLATHLRDPVAVEAGKQDSWFPTPTTTPPYFVDRREHLATPITGIGSGVTPSAHLLAELVPYEPIADPADRNLERVVS